MRCWGKNWKRAGIPLLAVAAMLVAAGCGGAATSGNSATQGEGGQSPSSGATTGSSGEQLTVKLAWYMPTGSATDKAGQDIAKKIEEKSNGTIRVQTYPGGALLTESNMGQGLQNNTVQMGILGIHWWSNQEPALALDQIPFVAVDPDKALQALHGQLGEDITQILERHGVSIAGWTFYGYAGAYINDKHPIRHPEDLKGLRMRADGPEAAYLMQHFGAVPTTIDSSEVYEALERGTIDGATSGISSFISRKWIEPAKFMTAVKQTLLVYPVQVNAKWWHGLSEEQRATISGAIQEAEHDNIQAINNDWDGGIKQAEQSGVQVTVVEGNALTEWQQKTSFMRDYYLQKTGADGQKLLNDLSSTQ